LTQRFRSPEFQAPKFQVPCEASIEWALRRLLSTGNEADLRHLDLRIDPPFPPAGEGGKGDVRGVDSATRMLCGEVDLKGCRHYDIQVHFDNSATTHRPPIDNSAKPDLAMPIVKFVNEKKEIEVAEGANLRAEAKKAGINLNLGVNGYGQNFNKVFNCLGKGMCGSCRVLVNEGQENTNEMTKREVLRFKTPFVPDPVPCLAFVGHEDCMRLACMTQVHGDIEVESGPDVNLFGENFFS
jgi:ferredoxin